MQYDARGFASARDGTRLFYGTRGDGPGLLLIDGIGCDGWAWNYIQPHLSETHRVLHGHYRGHGRSGPLVDPTARDIVTLAHDAVSVMDAAQLPRAVIVGHSMGTQVALEMFRHHRQRVDALILICGSYGKVTHTFHGNDFLHRVLPKLIDAVHRHPVLARALWGRLPAAFAHRVAGWLGEIDGPAVDLEDFRKYVEHLSKVELHLYLTMLQEAGEHTAEDMLESIDVPTLAIASEKDTFTPVEVMRVLAERIPNCGYVELAGASHAGPLERPALINDAMDEFFRTRL